MKIKHLLSATAIFFGTLLLGQTTTLQYIGALEVEGLKTLPIKLSFKVNDKGVFNGISTTDFFGPNRTSSVISGTLDPVMGLLSFQEFSNIETSSDADAGNFCYIKCENLNISNKKGREIIRGSFVGQLPNGEFCARGKITLMGANDLESLVQTDSFADELVKSEEHEEVVQDEGIKRPMKVKAHATLKNNESFKVKTESDTLNLVVWDSFQEDGDEVNIKVSSGNFFGPIQITEKRQLFKIPISPGTTYITIEAVEEGSSPPCTVSMHVYDTQTLQPLMGKIEKGKIIALKVIKP